MGCVAASLFFTRFWRKSNDPLFLMFAVAFGLLGVERLVLAFFTANDEFKPFVYLIRLAAFVVIILAIVNKNRKKD